MKLSTIKSALALSAVTAALVFASGSVSAQQHIAEQMLEKSNRSMNYTGMVSP